jgi:hypothetical protein
MHRTPPLTINRVITLPEKVSTTLPFLGTDIFLSLLEQSGLLADLDTRAAITILAPDDTAFTTFDHASLSPDQLLAVLKEHILVDYPAYSPLLENGDVYPTLAGGTVSVLVRDSQVFWNGARLLMGDAILRNGLVHIIDRVSSFFFFFFFFLFAWCLSLSVLVILFVIKLLTEIGDGCAGSGTGACADFFDRDGRCNCHGGALCSGDAGGWLCWLGGCGPLRWPAVSRCGLRRRSWSVEGSGHVVV